MVQFHWNGEPLLYPELGQALSAFRHCITGLDTNGILLMDKAQELIGNIDTLTISVIQNDDAGLVRQQKENIKAFVKLKGEQRPIMVYRLLGDVDKREWRHLPGIIATRVLHAPEGSVGYEKAVTIPEMGVCMDMLTSMAIDRYGKVNHCVRFDPDGLGVIGDLGNASLLEISEGIESQAWHVGKHSRRRYTELHVTGRRDEVPLCARCDFWGIPRGRE